jgi:hypothetical protein
LVHKVLFSVFQDVVPKFAEAIDIGTIEQHGFRVGLAAATDRIESFERESVGVDSFMAPGTVRIAAVAFNELALRQSGWSLIGQNGYSLRWLGELVAENNLADPGAAEDRTSTRCPGM